MQRLAKGKTQKHQNRPRHWRCFAPFNFLFSETEKKLQCQQNQKLIKICPKKSTSVPSDDPWFILYKLSKPFFFTAFQVELTV
jgi:hypothetical protein